MKCLCLSFIVKPSYLCRQYEVSLPEFYFLSPYNLDHENVSTIKKFQTLVLTIWLIHKGGSYNRRKNRQSQHTQCSFLKPRPHLIPGRTLFQRGDLQYLSKEGLIGIIEKRVCISKKMKRLVPVQIVRDIGDPRWNVPEGPCINTSRSIYPQDQDVSMQEYPRGFPGRFSIKLILTCDRNSMEKQPK